MVAMGNPKSSILDWDGTHSKPSIFWVFFFIYGNPQIYQGFWRQYFGVWLFSIGNSRTQILIAFDSKSLGLAVANPHLLSNNNCACWDAFVLRRHFLVCLGMLFPLHGSVPRVSVARKIGGLKHAIRCNKYPLPIANRIWHVDWKKN